LLKVFALGELMSFPVTLTTISDGTFTPAGLVILLVTFDMTSELCLSDFLLEAGEEDFVDLTNFEACLAALLS
jgi:hypothetical protein